MTPGVARRLDDDHVVWVDSLPDAVVASVDIDALWALHPAEPHTILVHGKHRPTPRFQQAYEADYHFSGTVSRSLPAPPLLQPLFDWATTHVHEALNGLLLNWYDAAAQHYIGKHRDSRRGLMPDVPIVTVSLGAPRTFRLRPWRGKGFVDLPLEHGSVILVPYDTNLAWTHEVPHFAADRGRRISVTLRAFEHDSASG